MTRTPSKRVADFLKAHADVDFEVIHLGEARCPPPYAIVAQADGDLEVAQVDIEVYGQDAAGTTAADAATAAALKVRSAMRHASLEGVRPSLAKWVEGYVVQADGKAHAVVSLRYNLPVYQER